MKTGDFREMDTARLTGRIEELQQELAHLKEAVRSGKEKNHAKIRHLRREVAQALTVQRELETKAL